MHNNGWEIHEIHGWKGKNYLTGLTEMGK